MERAIAMIKLLLPAFSAGGAVLVKVQSGGQLGVPLSLALVGGALLGWAVALIIESTAVIYGARPQTRSLGQRRLRQLERDKTLVLRSIKEIEFDAKIQQIGEEETALLTGALRARAKRLLRQIDDVGTTHPQSVDEQIDAELQRREAAQ